MSRKVVFGLLSLAGLLVAVSAPLAGPEGCADDKGTKKDGKEPVREGTEHYCPYYLVADYGMTRMYYAEKCSGTFVPLMLGKDDPYPGNCTDKTNCLAVQEKKEKEKAKHTKGKPLDPAYVFQGPKSGYSNKELSSRRALVNLETAADGTKKVKVMLYQVTITPPGEVSKAPLHIGVGWEVEEENKKPNVTIHHHAIQGRDRNHNVENVYRVKDASDFTYLVVLDADTKVDDPKKAK